MQSFGDSQNHNEIWLCWVDSSECQRKEPVTLLDVDGAEVILTGKMALDSRTAVSLANGSEYGSGTVVGCHPDGSNFIVIIRMVPSTQLSENPNRDPGVAAVEDFLTEEQERLLLQEIEEEWRGPRRNTWTAAN